MHPLNPKPMRSTAAAHKNVAAQTAPITAATARPLSAPGHRRWPLGAWIVWLVWVASASLHSQAALAADVSAAAASALKVLSVPLPDDATLPATAAPPSAPPEMAHFPASITVQRGESIDAVIRRGLPGLPLRDEFMRQALAKANPRIFPKGTTYPVRPGTVLQMPSIDALRQQMLSQHPQAAVLFQAGPAPSPETPAGTNKRHWVRFP